MGLAILHTISVGYSVFLWAIRCDCISGNVILQIFVENMAYNRYSLHVLCITISQKFNVSLSICDEICALVIFFLVI